MSSSIAIVSAATHYAFEQNGGVALSGKLGYIFVHSNGQTSKGNDMCFSGMTYKEYLPAYHNVNIDDAQAEAVKLLKGK